MWRLKTKTRWNWRNNQTKKSNKPIRGTLLYFSLLVVMEFAPLLGCSAQWQRTTCAQSEGAALIPDTGWATSKARSWKKGKWVFPNVKVWEQNPGRVITVLSLSHYQNHQNSYPLATWIIIAQFLFGSLEVLKHFILQLCILLAHPLYNTGTSNQKNFFFF